jgi:hypothetical protein
MKTIKLFASVALTLSTSLFALPSFAGDKPLEDIVVTASVKSLVRLELLSGGGGPSERGARRMRDELGLEQPETPKPAEVTAAEDDIIITAAVSPEITVAMLLAVNALELAMLNYSSFDDFVDNATDAETKSVGDAIAHVGELVLKAEPAAAQTVFSWYHPNLARVLDPVTGSGPRSGRQAGNGRGGTP